MPSACHTTSSVATCSVLLNGGDRGVVSVNVSVRSQNVAQGTPQFEFLVHSSAASYEDRGCQVSGDSAEMFRFSLVVSQTYGDATPRLPDSISVIMWANCSLP